MDARGPGLLTPADQCSLRQVGFPLAKEDAVSESPSKKAMAKVVIGVYRTPEQFVADAIARAFGGCAGDPQARRRLCCQG